MNQKLPSYYTGFMKIKTDLGNEYEGEWRDGLREGKGVYRFKNGSIYDGDWKAGKMSGRAFYRFADGSSY